MSRQERNLRLLIREMFLREQAEEERRKMLLATLNIRSPSGNSDFEEIVSLLDDEDLKIVKDMLVNKDRLGRAGNNDDELERRFGLIRKRINQTAAATARAIMMDNPGLVSSFKNWPLNGVATIDSPEIGQTYDVPSALNPLALFKKPGGHGESIGKGEALAILMFGRETDGAGEPDLVVGPDHQFSIKYFRSASATTKTGSYTPPNVQSASESTAVLVDVAKHLKIYAKDSRQITRSNIRKIAEELERAIDGKPDNEVLGGMRVELIRSNLDELYMLWDSASFSEHPVLALIGESDLKFEVMPISMVRLGVLRLDTAPHFGYEIAAPDYAKIDVRKS